MKFLRLALLLGCFGIYTSNAQPIPVVQIDSVTVVNNTSVSVTWVPSTDPRVDAYNVYRVEQNNFGDYQFFAPIFITGNTSNNLLYTDQTGTIDNPNKKPLRFYVQAVDTTPNPDVTSNLDSFGTKPHQTMLLNYTVDGCNSSAVLNWTKYTDPQNGWTDGPARYEVLESQNGGPYLVRYSGQNAAFVRDQLRTGVVYRYKIRAVSAAGNRSSSSNVHSVTGNFRMAPDYTYLSNVSVAADNQSATISWISGLADVKITYRILQSEDGINYKVVYTMDSVPYMHERNAVINGLNCLRKFYYFKVETSVCCPAIVDSSNVGKTILLRAEYVDPATNFLKWNNYQGWAVGTSHYKLYRVYNSILEDIATQPVTDTDYVDNDPILLTYGEGTVSYFLKAIENIDDPFNVQSSSQSNFAYIYKELRIVAPNIFSPKGINSVFMPRVLSANSNKFNMKIYNRWGKLVYETDDEFAGWDGKDRNSGEVATPGTYVYIIEAFDSSGQVLKKKGTIGVLD